MKIAERAVKAKGWRWMPGMLPLALDNDGDWAPIDRVWRTQGGRLAIPQGAIPDLTDPATLGCLRHLAAKAHGAWDIVIQVDVQPRIEGTHGWWRAIDSVGRKIQGAFGTFVCPNDGTDLRVFALVAALEAEP